MDSENLSKVNVLIVDDRPDNLTVLEAVLSSDEINLVRAESGLEAVSAASNTEFAVIILDVQMPEMDGFQAARLIRETSGPSKDAPIIFVTAIYGDEVYVNLGYDAGAVDYIFKPFNPFILKSKVGVFVDLFRKSKILLEQSEKLREAENLERIRELADVRYQAMERENRLQQKYRDLVNGIDHCVIWTADPTSLNVSFVSPRVKEILGYDPDEVRQADFWSRLVHPDDREAFLDALRNCAGGCEEKFEHRFVAADGRLMWFQTHVQMEPLGQEDRSGEIRGLSIDITALKTAQNELKKSEGAQRFLADSGSKLAQSLDVVSTLHRVADLTVPRFADWCVVHLVDDQGDAISAAQAHADPLKAEESDNVAPFYPLGSSDRHGVPMVLKNRATEIVDDIDVIPIKEQPASFGLLRSMGLKSYICVPMIAAGRAVGALTLSSAHKRYEMEEIHIIEDLARRAALALENARLYAEAEKAIKTRDEFLSIASHELRTPLTPLKIQFQTITKMINDGNFASLTPEKLLKILDRSDRQIDRLSGLIDDLLNVSRINLGRLNLEPKQVDVSKLIKEVVEQFGEQFKQSNCQVNLELNNPITCFWDPFKMEQVFFNLFSNAVKYGHGKPITVKARARGDLITINVRDQGIGIDSRDQEKIFGLFERAASSANYGGLGLGLFIVRSIVEQHGGKIRVESQPGNGSEFILEIPKSGIGLSKEKMVIKEPIKAPAPSMYMH